MKKKRPRLFPLLRDQITYGYRLAQRLTNEIENRGKLKEVQYLDHFTTLLPYYLIKLNSTLEGSLIGFELKPL